MSREAPPLVLHVIHHLVIGGMENGVINIINRLSPLDFRHAIVCIEDFTDFKDRLDRKDVEVIGLRRSRVGVWRVRREIYRLCRRLKPAIVHTRNLSGLDALFPARLAGVGCLIHGEHGWDIDNIDGKRLRPAMLRRIHRPLVRRFITVSRDLENYLVERIGVDRGKITQIYNGVDTRRFHPNQNGERFGLPKEWKGSDIFVVGSVGRLQPVKDQQTLLRSFAKVIEGSPALRTIARLVIVGDGPLATPLRALAAELGIADVTFFAGARTDVPEQLRNFDLFVLSSLNEGISNTALEAMASGVPIVLTDVGGNRELLADPACGSLVPAADVATLATTIRHYVEHRELVDEAGRAARRRAEAHFSIEAMTANYAEVYKGLLSTKAGAFNPIETASAPCAMNGKR